MRFPVSGSMKAHGREEESVRFTETLPVVAVLPEYVSFERRGSEPVCVLRKVQESAVAEMEGRERICTVIVVVLLISCHSQLESASQIVKL
jgi:hypothetical protein